MKHVTTIILLTISFLLLAAGIVFFISESYFSQGKFLEEEGKLQDAKYAYKKAVQFNPINPGYHRNLGIINFTLGEYDAALYRAKRAVTLGPHDAHNHQLLGRVYIKIQEKDKASSEFLKAVEYDQTQSPGMYKDLALLYSSQGKYIDTISLLDNILPKYPLSFFSSGIAAVIVQAHGERLRADISDLYNIQGISYANINQKDLAKDSFKKALEYVPNNIAAQNNLEKIESQ